MAGGRQPQQGQGEPMGKFRFLAPGRRLRSIPLEEAVPAREDGGVQMTSEVSRW